MSVEALEPISVEGLVESSDLDDLDREMLELDKGSSLNQSGGSCRARFLTGAVAGSTSGLARLLEVEELTGGGEGDFLHPARAA